MMHELDEAMQVIKDTARDAQIIFGLVYKDELELGDEVLVTVIATGFDTVEEEVHEIDDRNTAARYDDADTYQRQTPALPEQRVPSPSRVRQSVARTPSDRSRIPGRGQRANAEPSTEEENVPQSNPQKPARGRDQGSQQRETDWEIPAFLRVQKRRGNDK
jgi:cell division protein FtsZ